MPRKPLTPEQRERKRQRDRDYYARKRIAAGKAYSPKITFNPITIAGQLLDAAKQALKPEKARPPVPGVAFGPTVRKDTDSFDRFVLDNPHLSARQAIAEYRMVDGQTISNKLGFQRVREVREDDKQFEKVRFKMYGPHDNPLNKNYLMPSRFLYFVRYEVEVEGHPETFTQYIHIQSKHALSPKEIKEATILAFETGQEKGKERYIAKRIDPNTIFILFGIDREKKS